MLFKLLGAAAHRRNVSVATSGAGTRDTLRKTAMVTPQGAVNFVKHSKGTAMRAFTFPTAICAMQDWCIASAIEQQHALLTFGNPRLNGGNQRCRQHCFARLMVHVNAPHKRQLTRTNSRRHLQTQIPATLFCRAALVPAF